MQLDTARAITLFSMFGTMAILGVLVVVALDLGIDHRDPLEWLAGAAMEDFLAASAWLLAVMVCIWLMFTSFGYAAVAVYGLRRTGRAISWMTLPIVRRAIDTIAAVSIVSATLGPFAAAAAAARVAATSDISAAIDERITRLVPPGVLGVGYTLTPPAGADDADGSPGRSRAVTPSTRGRIHVVEEGDNLWRIACREVRGAVAEPTLDLVTDYWLDVIEANRATLRSNDPDLIYPGERIALPPLPGAHDTS